MAGRRRVAGALAVQWPRIAAALAGLGDRDAAKVALVGRLLTGMPAATVAEAVQAFASRLERRLRPDMVEQLQWHQAEGHRTVIVSASLAVYLEPVGRRLAVDEVLATDLAVGDDGRLTGGLVGANVRGPEKACRLGAYLAAAGEECELWAYGDSKGDRELLAMADHPQRVGRR